jgi:hypothetical protein
MALLDDVRKVAGVAERLTGPVGNEANTKALLIEPMLSALGWDTTNLDHVLRDWPVGNAGSVDYALRIGEDNAMFVEARGLNESLDDESFATRAVDSAGGEGVLWCAVTNGLIYRVYRTDEAVPTHEKLSFEVDLSKAAVGSPSDTATVPLLSRASVSDGSLALWGEQRVFTDPRVRAVLSELAAKPSAAFLDAINEAIGERKVPRDRLRTSLGRVLVIETGSKAATPRPPALPRREFTPPPASTRTAAPAARPEPAAQAPSEPEAVEAPQPTATAPTTEAPKTDDTQHAQPEAAHAEEPTDTSPAETAAKRRFLGGHGKGSKDDGGSDVDPYAPLSQLDDPFADT